MVITTAGTDRSGICYERRTHVTKILDRVVQDERVFGIIYTLDEGDDHFDPAVWIKANPNLGKSVQLDELMAQASKAQAMPSALSNFLTKRLNVWGQRRKPLDGHAGLETLQHKAAHINLKNPFRENATLFAADR